VIVSPSAATSATAVWVPGFGVPTVKPIDRTSTPIEPSDKLRVIGGLGFGGLTGGRFASATPGTRRAAVPTPIPSARRRVTVNLVSQGGRSAHNQSAEPTPHPPGTTAPYLSLPLRNQALESPDAGFTCPVLVQNPQGASYSMNRRQIDRLAPIPRPQAVTGQLRRRAIQRRLHIRIRRVGEPAALHQRLRRGLVGCP
jgi:hypothetical protein